MDKQTAQTAQPRLRTNLDTDLLKLIAIAAMLADHIGGAFFPAAPWFRWIGRLAFPLFCYCMTVGLLYTHSIKRYLGRLAIFAVVSQPFWILAFNADDILGNLTNWNIFFTLLLSLLAMWGLTTRRWWLFVLCVLALAFGSFDYNYNGVILMLIFYFCRNRPALLAGLYILFWLPALWGGSLEDPLALVVGGHAVNWTIFALLALPLILARTHSGPENSQMVLLRLLSRPSGRHCPGGMVHGRVRTERRSCHENPAAQRKPPAPRQHRRRPGGDGEGVPGRGPGDRAGPGGEPGHPGLHRLPQLRQDGQVRL